MSSTSTVAVLVCDLVESTARHARLGEDAADVFRARFFAALRDAVERNDGEIVKNLGDGLLVVFRRSTVAALTCAHDLHEAVLTLDPDDAVRLRVGVSAGEVAEEDGDWFGMPVIEASRLCALAAPMSTVTTGVVRNLVGSRGTNQFKLIGPKDLKGIPTAVEAWTVSRGGTVSHPAEPNVLPARPRRTVTLAAIGIALVGLVAAVATIVVRDADSSTPSTAGPATNTEPTAASVFPTSGVAASSTSTSTATSTSTSTSVEAARVVAPTNYTPILSDRDCATDPDAGEAFGIECWTLTVPEDRADPERTIELHGYRIPAATDPDNAPTVIDLGPTTTFASYPLSEVANIVMIPSRGFGLSTPAFDCPEVAAVREAGLALPSDDPTVASLMLDALRSCRERLVASGFNLPSYNFEAEISDVADYLIAAGVDESFITALPEDAPAVLVAADRFPGTFRGVFLQNPVDPGTAWQADPARDLAAAFSRYAALCAANVACGTSYPDLAADYSARYERMTRSPKLVEDVPHGGQHSRIYPVGTARTFDVLMDGDRLTHAYYSALRVKVAYASLADATNDQSETYVASSATLALIHELSRGVRDAAFYSYQCAVISTLAPGTGPSSAAALPPYGAMYDETFVDRCMVWDVPPLSPEFNTASNGETPTLIAVGELAPVPAALWADNLRRSRRNTTVVTFPTLGANIEYFGPRCYQDLLQQFVLDPTARLDVDACAAQSPAIEFIVAAS